MNMRHSWVRSFSFWRLSILFVCVAYTGLLPCRAAPADARQIARLPAAGGTVLQFSKDGKRLLAVEGAEARVWDATVFKPLTESLRHGERIWSASLSLDGKKVLTATGSQVWIWDVQTGKRILALEQPGKVWSAAFSPDGTKVLASGTDKAARVWEIATGKLLFSLGHAGKVWFAAFSPDGNQIITMSHQGDEKGHGAFMWDASSGRKLWASWARVGSHSQSPAAFSQDGKKLVLNLFDSDLVVEAGNGTPLAHIELDEHGVAATSVFAFSPDGNRLLTVGMDGLVYVWEANKSGAPLSKLELEGRADDAVFTREGKRIVVTAEHGEAGVFDAGTGKSYLRFPTGDPTPAVALSPEGKRVALSYPKAGEIIVWDIAQDSLR
jgi:WD40 repeat protein